MRGRRRTGGTRSSLTFLGVVFMILGLSACATTPEPDARRFDLFVDVSPSDIWTPRIVAWQASQLLDRVEGRTASDVSAPFADRFRSFSQELRLEMATRTLEWVQAQAGLYYRPDGEHDHWPTTAQMMETGRDDCDGFDLLTLEMLRSFGFGDGELYRSILVDRESGSHHMVTLWFPEPRAVDPWVLDPTAFVTRPPARLSALDGWSPIAIFDEREQYRASAVEVPPVELRSVGNR